MSEFIELEPCPFCGRAPRLFRNYFGYCYVCMNPVCPVYRADNAIWKCKKDAAQAWNKRGGRRTKNG